MKKNVAVLMGGYSSEYDISIKSGQVVLDNLDKELYLAFKIVIRSDEWIYLDNDNNKFKISKDDFSVQIKNKKIKFDIAFIIVHGSPGEDGLLQSYFDLIGIPYTGCSAYTSALTFNKKDCISVLQKYNIPSAKSINLNLGDDINEDMITKTIGLPCFVKANKSGSSFGVFKVYNKEDLKRSIENSFKIDNEVLVEAFLDGIEVSVGVMNYRNNVEVFGITQLVSDNDFFDYEAKYQGKHEEISPARLSEIQKTNVENAAIKIYKNLNMSGFSRSDFIFIGDDPYLLEVNSIPGMTEESIFPKQVKMNGISLKELFTYMIENTLVKFKK